MPFGVLLVFRTQVCFSHAREFSICTCFFFQKRGSEQKYFPQFMNQSESISPQMLELPKSLILRSFCFQNQNVSTKVRLFFSTRHFLFTKNRRKHCPQLWQCLRQWNKSAGFHSSMVIHAWQVKWSIFSKINRKWSGNKATSWKKQQHYIHVFCQNSPFVKAFVRNNQLVPRRFKTDGARFDGSPRPMWWAASGRVNWMNIAEPSACEVFIHSNTFLCWDSQMDIPDIHYGGIINYL